ncbi:MAG: archaeal heat shock protein Hsp20 [Nitrososphaerota archaeon]
MWFGRRRRWPFFRDIFEEFEEFAREMEREFEEEMRRLTEQLPKDLVRETVTDRGVRREYGPFVYGYSITIGPDGKPIIRQFGNVRPGALPRGIEFSPEREPLVDVIEEDKQVKVIAELPGVNKEDIDLRVEEKMLTIKVDTPSRKYFKEVSLPTAVSDTGAKATYNNGVLEVVLPKKETRALRGERVKVE